MKLTTNQLKKIIKEEVQNVVDESIMSDFFSDEETGVEIGLDSAIKRAAEWIEPILQKKSSSLSDNFVNRIKRFSKVKGLHKSIHRSFETEVDYSDDGLKITLAPNGKGGVGLHWLTLYIDTPIKIDKGKVKFSVFVRAETGLGSRGYATTHGASLWDRDGHHNVATALKNTMLKTVAKGFPESAGMDVNTDPSYPFYITVAEDIDPNDTAFKILQLLYTPVVEVWSVLLFGNTISYKISHMMAGDHLGRVDIDTVPEIEKFWSNFQRLMQKS